MPRAAKFPCALARVEPISCRATAHVGRRTLLLTFLVLIPVFLLLSTPAPARGQNLTDRSHVLSASLPAKADQKTGAELLAMTAQENNPSALAAAPDLQAPSEKIPWTERYFAGSFLGSFFLGYPYSGVGTPDIIVMVVAALLAVRLIVGKVLAKRKRSTSLSKDRPVRKNTRLASGRSWADKNRDAIRPNIRTKPAATEAVQPEEYGVDRQAQDAPEASPAAAFQKKDIEAPAPAQTPAAESRELRFKWDSTTVGDPGMQAEQPIQEKQRQERQPQARQLRDGQPQARQPQARQPMDLQPQERQSMDRQLQGRQSMDRQLQGRQSMDEQPQARPQQGRQPQEMQFRDRQHQGSPHQDSETMLGQWTSVAPGVTIPPGFDAPYFLDWARSLYITLQYSWAARQVRDLAPYVSRPMLNILKAQAAKDPQPVQISIDFVYSRLVDIRHQNDWAEVSILFTVSMRSGAGGGPVELREVWRFACGGENSSWRVVAIEQA